MGRGRGARSRRRPARWSSGAVFRPDELRELWREAGLEDLRTTALVAGAAYSSFDDLWQPLEGGVGPATAYVAALPTGPRGSCATSFAADSPWGTTRSG